MEIANCRLWTCPHSDVPQFNVTPAQVAIWRTLKQHAVGHDPVHAVKIVGEASRPREAERLRMLFGAKAFQSCFPGTAPTLPATFEEIGVKAEKATGDAIYPHIKDTTDPAFFSTPAPADLTPA